VRLAGVEFHDPEGVGARAERTAEADRARGVRHDGQEIAADIGGSEVRPAEERRLDRGPVRRNRHDRSRLHADKAERAREIDIDRAEEARKRAEQIKLDAVHKEDVDFAALSAQIEKELARTKAVKKWRKIKGPDNVS
jgi:uncharacterized protein (DUF1786 family)